MKKNNLNCILINSHRLFEQIERKSNGDKDLEELSSLTYTLGLNVIDSLTLNLKKANPSTFYGKGQLESVNNKASALNCSYVIFNDDITPSQFKNIQKIILRKTIFDRTGVIIEIFRNNAKTKESKLQVELASLQYMLPRLTRQWTHLERQMGGTGTRGGPGEKQIEIDRRLIGRRITKLKTELSKIKKNREIQSHSRKNIFRVSLVGYTNAGKSSLLNALSKPETTYVEDKLFATLDTTTRNISISKNCNILVTDTVGFIKNLPHDLVASFRSTFEEVSSSQLILIVVDASSSKEVISDHIATIQSTLKDMKIKISESLLVFNKIDNVHDREKIEYLKKQYPASMFVSALSYIMVDELIDYIRNIVKKDMISRVVKIPHQKSFLLKDIYEKFDIESRKDGFDYIELKISGFPLDLDKIENAISEK